MKCFEVPAEVEVADLERSLQTLVRWVVNEHRRRLAAQSPAMTVPSLSKPVPPTSVGERRLMNVDGLATYLSLPKATIYSWVSMRKIPEKAIVRLGRSLKFDIKEIEAWLDVGRTSR